MLVILEVQYNNVFLYLHIASECGCSAMAAYHIRVTQRRSRMAHLCVMYTVLKKSDVAKNPIDLKSVASMLPIGYS